MAKTKLIVSPRELLAKAPGSVKASYFATLLFALTWFSAEFAAEVSKGNWFAVVGTAVVAYLVADSGLVVLRGRSMGRSLATFWAVIAAGLAAWQIAAPYQPNAVAGILTIAAGIFGVVAVGLLQVKGVREYFAAHAGDRLIANLNVPGKPSASKGAPVSGGSFEDILAEEKRK